MEGVCKYYKIAAFEDYYRVRVDTVSQNSCYYIMGFELWRVAAVIVSKRKAVTNTQDNSDRNRNSYQRNSCIFLNKQHVLCVKPQQL